MKAINQLSFTSHEVKQYKNVMYFETESKALPYYILKQEFISIDSIDSGFLYTYYTIGDNLYSGFLTNDFKAFVSEEEQLQLFNANDYY